jgi:8-hydroxy-5-deazaflavin:NADPH oxidoreductase
MASHTHLAIGLLGGTGAQGRGLATRFALAGHEVRIGSRDPDRAADVASELTTTLRGRPGVGVVEGASNTEVVDGTDAVVLCTPYEAMAATVEPLTPALAHRVLISCVNPWAFDAEGPYAPDVAAGSAAQELAGLVPAAQVVAAFHHLPAPLLSQDGPPHEATVMVCGDDDEAKRITITLAAAVATHGGIDVGGLRHARHLEALTAVLIDINRRHDAHAGIHVTGIDGH